MILLSLIDTPTKKPHTRLVSGVRLFLVRVFITDLMKKKSSDNEIRYRYSIWHILHHLIQCNAMSPSIACVKPPDKTQACLSNKDSVRLGHKFLLPYRTELPDCKESVELPNPHHLRLCSRPNTDKQCYPHAIPYP